VPAARTTFLEFQARNRRAIWRLTAVCALVVGGGGVLAALGFLVNLFLVVFALIFLPAVLLLGLGLLASLSPATAAYREPLWAVGLVVLDGLQLVTRLGPDRGPALPVLLAVALSLGAWLAVRAVWLTAGVGETLLAMRAREPVSGDLEEHQLLNVVGEMAIAAGIPAPAVRLLDPPVANAAAVGRGIGDCYLVVGRQLLDDFDREETEAVLGHLIGSVGNGDLRGAAEIHSMLYLLELLIVIVLAPFARYPRRVALAWLAVPVTWPVLSPERRAERARALIALLAQHRHLMRGDPERPGAGYFGPIGRILVSVCGPLLALLAFGQAATGLLLLLVSLPVALLWRSRRYLADATAVELLRNPTALYRALARLGTSGAVVPGGQAASHLFIVPPAGGAGQTPIERGTLADREGLLMGLHPALKRRLARLVRMGATPSVLPP
jgi:Zn-dependent protease with chaperone function